MSVTVYRVSVRDRDGKHKGYEYFLRRFMAESAVIRAKARMWKAELKEYEVPAKRARCATAEANAEPATANAPAAIIKRMKTFARLIISSFFA